MGDYPAYGYTSTVYTSPDEYPAPFNGAVRIPSVVSGRGYYLQSARLELQHRGCLVRKLATLQDTGVGKGCNPRKVPRCCRINLGYRSPFGTDMYRVLWIVTQ